MTAWDFLYLLEHNWDKFIFIFIINILIIIPIIKYRCKGIFDPLLRVLVFSSFANMVPCFLFATNKITLFHFSYFVIAEVMFWGVFLFLSNNQVKLVNKKNDYCPNYDNRVFGVCIVLFIISQLLYYMYNGFPIFNDNRFVKSETSSSLLGILLRISSMCDFFVYIMAVHYIFEKRKIGYFLSLFLILNSLLMGSKGFILNFVNAYFFYSLLFLGKRPSIKFQYLIIVLITPLLTLFISGYSEGVTMLSSLYSFLFRLIACGDIYWNIYGDNVIEYVHIDNPLLNMSYLFWGPFRNILGVPDSYMDTIGSIVFEKVNLFYPYGGAPNSRLTPSSYVFFGLWGLLFVFFMSYLLTKVHNKCYNTQCNSLVQVCCTALLYFSVISIPSDIYLFFNRLFTFFSFWLLAKLLKIR